MEDRLRNLKKSRVSTQLEFTERHRSNIYKAIEREVDNEEDVKLAVLQLLAHKRTGYELLQLLIGRGIKKFADYEGSLYFILHELEQKEFILSEWSKDQQKYYLLNQKGNKYLRKTESKHDKAAKSLNELLRGDLSYE